MKESIIKIAENKIEFESGESIEIVIKSTNIKNDKKIKDFLEGMFKEILNDYF
ncbi:MAG: hypothetical protein ACLTK7_08555 [Clostridium paraputrificum]